MDELVEQIRGTTPAEIRGQVARSQGPVLVARGCPVPLGALLEVHRRGLPPLLAEAVGFQEHETLMIPLETPQGIRPGDPVRLKRSQRWAKVGPELLGRVIDALGRPLDDAPAPLLPHRRALEAAPPPATQRGLIDEPLSTGIRAIDGLLTCGVGQRMGIFAGSGVGKSTLIGMMARYSSAQVNVIALIGERGREVNQFLESELGPEGLARSVVVVATSDQPAPLRIRAAQLALAVAEYFRDQGQRVLLLLDSVTRYAMALRELGLSAGEPPATRGYPPSVFAALPKLVERAGMAPRGSITAFFSVLVEGDDHQEPIADTMRGLLDGHVWLSRSLASRGHFPAIDVLESISRLMPRLATPEQQEAAAWVRRLLAVYRDNEDLITIGAYRQGSDPQVDLALRMRQAIDAYLQQPVEQPSDLARAQAGLAQILQAIKQQQQQAATAGANPAAPQAAPGASGN